jgi:hypothetical protein
MRSDSLPRRRAREEYDARVDLDAAGYARICVERGAGGEPRARVLARHGLDEASWRAADAAWQERISEAMAADGDEVPAVLSEIATATAAAQEAIAPPISLEQFALATRLVDAGADLGAALAAAGVTLAEYVRGSQHRSRRIAEDAAIEARFEAALRGR